MVSNKKEGECALSRRRFGKKNEIKIDPLNYNICLLGEPKIGKTTIIKEMLEKLAGDDGYIFLEMAGESGADAISNIIFEDVDDWGYLEEIIEDIEYNKTTHYPNLRAIVVDTFDGWIELAQEEAIRMWNIENPDKRATSIDAAWGGFQRGQAKAFDLMFDIMKRLRKVNVATIVIGHVRSRDLTDVASGETYRTLTSDVEKVYFNLLKKKMHFLGLAYYDRTIITEKTGKKNIVTKKDITVNKIVDESRKIKFRDDNMALDSGSRFADIVPEVAFDVDELIKALNDAIKKEAEKGTKPVEQLKKEQEQAELEKVKKIAKAEEEKKKQRELDEVINKITDYIKANKSDLDKVKPILEKCKEFGVDNPTQLTDIKQAKEVLKIAR